MSAKTSSALEAAYNTLLQRRRLLPNPHQAALISRLAQLQHDLFRTAHHQTTALPPPHHQRTKNLTTTLNHLSGPPVRTPIPNPQGLYIYGSVGTGKSRLMDLFSDTLDDSISDHNHSKKKNDIRISRRRVHFHEFMMDVHARLHRARGSSSLGRDTGDPLVAIGRQICVESRLLCFDEFQITDIADAMILGRLFASIWHSGGVVVCTSNRHPTRLYENGLNRDVVLPFLGELERWCEVWRMGGERDYRLRNGEREGNFLVEERGFYERLEREVAGREMEVVEIPVQGGRRLEVSAVVAIDHYRCEDHTGGRKRLNVVSGTFEEFCERFLGSPDYYALCTSTDTIFISGLRAFGPSDRDFVRRFITLIDLAYETKTRVICQSEVPLGEVFVQIARSEQKKARLESIKVKGEGGASSSMMSTFVGETEWSATGLMEASLASGGAGETDVGFAIGRAISRLHEMGSKGYGSGD